MNPPKPSALKLLQGNPGKRAINKSEPKPYSCIPECPSHLDAMARKIWARVGDRLLRLGLVTELDETMFALYCQTYSTWLQLSRDVKKEGVFIPVPVIVDGEPITIDGKALTTQEKNPKQIELRLLTVQLKNLAAEFGMSPSSRTRLSIDLPEGEEDEMKGWIEGKRANG